MIQEEQVLFWCKHHKGITSAEAFYNLGIAHLPRVVANLAEKGHDVKKVQNTASTTTPETKHIGHGILFHNQFLRGYYDKRITLDL